MIMAIIIALLQAIVIIASYEFGKHVVFKHLDKDLSDID